MVESAEEPVGISADLRAYIDGAVTGRMASAGDDRVARLDRQLAQTVARLTEIIDAARRDSIEREPVQVGALRAELHAALAARDSRLAAIEAVQGVEAASEEAITVRLTAVEHEVREAVAAAQAAAFDVDALRTQMQSELTQQLSGVRAEVAEETEDLIAMVGEDLTKRLDRLARQVAAVTSWRDSTDAALTRVDHEIAELSESVKADRATLATHVSQLDSSLARLAEWQAEIEERVGSMVRPARPAPAEPTAPGGGRRKIRGADIERLVESVESWRAESVGEEEFVALRTDLENMVARRIASARAEMQHRIEMVEAVVADAGADTADTASMRCDLETLQEQVATLLKSRTPPRAKRTPRDSG